MRDDYPDIEEIEDDEREITGDHTVPADLMDLSVELEELGMTPKEFAKVMGGST